MDTIFRDKYLGDMQPGEGYMIFTNEDVIFEYNTENQLRPVANDVWETPLVENPPYSSGKPFAVICTVPETIGGKVPALIELYDRELLVGKALILEDKSVTPVIAWEGSEEYAIPGFNDGHPIRVKLLASSGQSLMDKVYSELQFGVGPFAEIAFNSSDENWDIPSFFSIESVYPNPFNSITTIPISIPNPGELDIVIYNLLGQVMQQSNLLLPSGIHRYTVNGDNLVSGIYFIRIEGFGESVTQKIMLIK